MFAFSRSAKQARLKKSYDRYQMNPGEAESLAVGRQLVALGRTHDAFRWMRKARTHFPQSARIEKLYATVKARKTERSLREAKIACEIDPIPQNLVRYSELLRIAGKLKKARRIAERAEKQHPDDWEVQVALGRVYFQLLTQKKSDKYGRQAIEHFEAALASNPADYAALLFLGMTLVRLQMFPEAHEVVLELLQVLPDDQRAQNLLEYIHRFGALQDGATYASGEVAQAGEVEDVIQAVLDIPGAVGALLFNDDLKVEECSVDSSEAFDLDAGSEVFEAMVSAFHGDATRLGLGDLRCCTVRGEGWNIGYTPGDAGTVLAFFEGDESEEQITVDMEAVLGNSLASA